MRRGEQDRDNSLEAGWTNNLEEVKCRGDIVDSTKYIYIYSGRLSQERVTTRERGDWIITQYVFIKRKGRYLRRCGKGGIRVFKMKHVEIGVAEIVI